MTLKETATIAFSSALAGGSVSKKQDALIKLLDYIETHEEIENIDGNGEHILETVYSIFVSFVEQSQLAKTYRLTIAIRDLSLEDTRTISAMGFDVYSAEGLRLAG
jgi:hypothetical protein